MPVSEKKLWDVFNSHYQQHGIARHQIESFNDFIENGIPRILHEEPDIVIKKPDMIYRVAFSDAYVPEPAVMEEGLKLRTDRNPAECRLRNLNYESTIQVTVTEYVQELKDGAEPLELPKSDDPKAKLESALALAKRDDPVLVGALKLLSGKTETLEIEESEPYDLEKDYLSRFKPPTVRTHTRVPLAKIPIMLRSGKCRLTHMTPQERIEAGEDERDHGGYFILGGKERVLVSQTRMDYNTVTVRKGKADKKLKYSAQIRSMSEETGHSVALTASIGEDDRTLVFTLPYVKDMVPMGVVFRALGVKTKEELTQVIGLHIPEAQRYIGTIYRDSFRVDVRSQEDAIKYIASCVAAKTRDADKPAVATQVIESELLPHMGVTATPKEKLYFLGHMVKKLLLVQLGKKKLDNRDDYRFKRIEPAGDLILGLFRTLFKQYVGEIRKGLTSKKTSLDIRQQMKFGNKITNALRHAFTTGNWAVQKANYTRVGVSQVLKRYFGASLSHLRTVMVPDGKDSKSKEMRKLHASECGYLCAWETPEGESVGVVINLALMARISIRIPTVQVKQVVERMDSILSVDEYDGENADPKVFVNGSLVGFADIEEFTQEFKILRKQGAFGNDISIGVSRLEHDQEIRIHSDEGRMMRPVFNAKGADLLLTEDSEADWDALVEKGVISYLDNDESAELVGTFDQRELSQYKCDYFEHPAMMMGVMASSSPFPTHSPSPRLCYQSNMGKQAVGEYSSAHPIRSDTLVHTLRNGQAPIVRTQPATMMGFDDRPAGVNAIVAIMTYGGQNQEDSVIINQSAIERGLLGADTWRTHTEETKREPPHREARIGLPPVNKRRKDWNYSLLGKDGVIRLRIPKESVYTYHPPKNDEERERMEKQMITWEDRLETLQERLDEASFRGESVRQIETEMEFVQEEMNKLQTRLDGGTLKETHMFNQQVRVQKGDVIIGKYLKITDKTKTEDDVTDCSLAIKKGEEGVIERVFESIASSGYKIVKVTIRSDKTPEIGDKVAARSAQKGVIGMVFRQEDMPYTADGIVPDILMNPHAFKKLVEAGSQ